MSTYDISQDMADQLTVICTSCGRTVPFTPGQSTCPVCSASLFREDALHPCIACGMEFLPSDSPLCPSCSLHYQEMFCMTCGEVFRVAPCDDNERMHTCPHCGNDSFRPFYLGGATLYAAPFGSFGTPYPLTDYPTEMYPTTDYPFEKETYPVICSFPVASATVSPISSSLKEYEFDLTGFLAGKEAPSLRLRALSLACDTSALPSGSQLRATLHDRRSCLMQQATAIPEYKERDKCLFTFETVDDVYTTDFSLSLEVLQNGNRLSADITLYGSEHSPIALWRDKDNSEFTPALTLFGYMVNRNTGEQKFFPTPYPESEYPELPGIPTFFPFTTVPETIWQNYVQGGDVEQRMVSELFLPIALPAGGEARIDLIDFAVDTYSIGAQDVEIVLGGGETIRTTTLNMADYFLRVDFGMAGIPESRRIARASGVYIRIPGVSSFSAFFNKNTGEAMGVINGEIMIPTTDYPTSEYPTTDYPTTYYDTTDYTTTAYEMTGYPTTCVEEPSLYATTTGSGSKSITLYSSLAKGLENISAFRNVAPLQYAVPELPTEYVVPTTAYAAANPQSGQPDTGNNEADKYCPTTEYASIGNEGTESGQAGVNPGMGGSPEGSQLPTGQVSMASPSLNKDMSSPLCLKYRHVTQRRITGFNSPTGNLLDAQQVCLMTERGFPRFTDFTQDTAGQRTDRSLTKAEQLRKITIDTDDGSGLAPQTCFEEILGDGTHIRYSAQTGAMIAIKTLNGPWLTAEDMENDLRLIYVDVQDPSQPADSPVMSNTIEQATSATPGMLRQVWSRRDGLMDITIQSETKYTMSWYSPQQVGEYNESLRLYSIMFGSVPVKSWTVEATPISYYTGADGRMYENGTNRPLSESDLNYLKSLKVTEQRGSLCFVSRWEQPDKTTMIFTRGEGDEAETVVTSQVATDPASYEELQADTPFLDNTFLQVGDVLTREMDVIETVPGIDGGSRTRYRRYAFGDVCLEREEGYNTALARVTRYIYDLDSTSRSYGCCIEEQRPEGYNIEYAYDSQKRPVFQKQPWAGGGYKITRFTYDLSPGSGGNVSSVTESLLINGEEREISSTRHSCTQTPEYTEERTVRLGIMMPVSDGGLPVPQVSVSQWHGADASTNGHSCPYAAGRIRMTRNAAGIQNDYVYENGTEPGIAFTCTVTKTAAGEIQEGQSTRVIHSYDADGIEVKMSQWVHTGTGFSRVGEETYTRDASHRVIRTDHLNGRYETAVWICKGPLEKTDENGVTTVYQYNSAKRLVCESRGAAVFTPGAGEAEQAFPLPSVVTEYFHDAAGRETERRITTGETVVSSFTDWDALGRRVSQTSEDGTITQFTYSGDGLEKGRVSPAGATFLSRDYFDGNVLQETGTGQRAEYYSYDLTSYDLVTRVRMDSPGGPLVSENYTNGFGQVIYSRQIQGNGELLAELHQYDSAGREILRQKENRPPVLYEYDAFGNVVRQTKKMLYASHDQVEETESSFVLEAFDPEFLPAPKPEWAGQTLVWRKTVHSRSTGEGHDRISETSWEWMGGNLLHLDSIRIYRDKSGLLSVSWRENNQGTSYSYDIREGQENCSYAVSVDGRQVCRKASSGPKTTYLYQYLSRGECLTVTDGRGNSTITQYDKAHRPISVRDAAGSVTTNEYNDRTGLLDRTTAPDGSVVEQEYDIRGRLTARFGTGTAPVCFEYDEANRMTALVTFRVPGEMLSLSPRSRSDGDKVCMIYNAGGLPVRKTYPDGRFVTFTYNDIGQPVSRTQSRGIVTTYSYDYLTDNLISVCHSDGTPGIRYSYDVWGQVVSVEDVSGKTIFTYTDNRDPDEEIHTGIYDAGLHRYTNDLGLYDGYDLLLDGQLYEQNSLQYDNGLRISGLVCTREGKESRYGFSWGADSGLADTVTFPNGIVKTFDYESRRNLVTGLRYGKDGSSASPADELTLSYDAAGRIVNKYGKAQNRSHAYAYNDRSEVVSDQRSNGGLLTWDYDNAGNRVAAGTESVDWNYETNELNQYTAIEGTYYPDTYSVTPEYDADGNQVSVNTSTGAWQVIWDAENRPVTFLQGNRRVECFYDSLGRRMRKKVLVDGVPVSHRCYLYDGYRLVAEMDALDCEAHPKLARSWVWDPTMGESASSLEVMVWKEENTSPEEPQPTTEYPESTTEYPEPPEPEGEREIVNHPVDFNRMVGFNEGIGIGGGNIYVDGVEEINIKGTRISYSGSASDSDWSLIGHNDLVSKSQVENRLAGVAPLDAREYRHMGGFGQIKDKYLPEGAWSISLVYYEDGLYLDQLIKPGAMRDIVFFRGTATVCDVGTVYALQSPDSWIDAAGQTQTRASFVDLNLVAVRAVSFKLGDMITLPDGGYVNLYCREINNPNGPQAIV